MILGWLELFAHEHITSILLCSIKHSIILSFLKTDIMDFFSLEIILLHQISWADLSHLAADRSDSIFAGLFGFEGKVEHGDSAPEMARAT